MKRIYAKEDLCLNCRLCEVYCKTAHSKSKNVIAANKAELLISRISVCGDNMRSVAINCRHCDEPKCVEACITGAMQKDSKSGIVFVDENKCIGCMTCAAVCPFGAIRHGKVAVKCDLCRKEAEPACVKNCPNKALVFAERGELE